jgi:hypothetical protein
MGLRSEKTPKLLPSHIQWVHLQKGLEERKITTETCKCAKRTMDLDAHMIRSLANFLLLLQEYDEVAKPGHCTTIGDTTTWSRSEGETVGQSEPGEERLPYIPWVRQDDGSKPLISRRRVAPKQQHQVCKSNNFPCLLTSPPWLAREEEEVAQLQNPWRGSRAYREDSPLEKPAHSSTM